jgi:hypothetical protein
MIRRTLIAATLATLVTASSALAQANAPVRTLVPSTTTGGTAVTIAERKTDPCADRNCASKPPRRDSHASAAPLGW